MNKCTKLITLVAFAVCWERSAYAHEPAEDTVLVIDTDVGLDDAVTLAMALQHPRIRIASVVACEGASSGPKAAEYLERMLDLFNRRDISLHAAARPKQAHPAPRFRPFVEKTVGDALSNKTARFRRPFSPDAYVSADGKTTVLLLGPFTNLATALERKPAIKRRIEKILVAGSRNAEESWNARYDPEAFAAVRASGIPIVFVVSGSRAAKPRAWGEGPLHIGQGTSIGERFLTRLLANPHVREHYLRDLGSFHDELAFLFFVDSGFFSETATRGVFAPKDNTELIAQLESEISRGRQRKARVAFTEQPFPARLLREDIRKRRSSIIAKNGEDEWFAELLLNELHEHLGVYSIIGVKMGLRAAELLNAPQHAMEVVSHIGSDPPFSCLNDGLIVAVGSTPGRGLFRHLPDAEGAVRATFAYNGRRITLALKESYRARINQKIGELARKYGLADHGYWDGVRRFGLVVWECWHRKNLFVTVETGDSR